jgi:hypothetical protein
MSISFQRLLLLFVMIVSPVWAGDRKAKNMAVTFHIETEAAANPKMFFEQQIGGKRRFFQRSPDFNSSDVVAFGPFLADNQVDFGMVLKLRPIAASRLESLTSANQGKMLLAMFNGKPIDAVIIDQPVKDGHLVIWNGITEAEIKECEKVVPRIGKEKKK